MKVKKEMGNDPPLISVILPFFNAPYLKTAIESILGQTYTHFELLIIDNASTDSSAAVARAYAQHPQVRLIHEPRHGVVYASNKGIKHTNGSLIARMDADDIALPNRLELQCQHFLQNPQLGVVSGLVEYLGPADNQGFIHYVDWLNTIVSREAIYLNQFVEFPMANPSIMFKKELVQVYGPFYEGDFPEDYEFFLRLQSQGVVMEKVRHPVLKWRDLPTRLTRTDSRYSNRSFFKIKAKYLARWLKKNNPFYPHIYLWGGGRLSRKRSDFLLEKGLKVEHYLDVKTGRNQMHYEQVPSPNSCFVVSYVANRGARDQIRDFLNQKGYVEGKNYIMAS